MIKRLFSKGIEQKVFNTILIIIIFILGAVVLSTTYQIKNISHLATETNRLQNEAIKKMSLETMVSVVNNSLIQGTAQSANLAEMLFSAQKERVETLSKSIKYMFENSSSFPKGTIEAPSLDKEGVMSLQILFDDGVDLRSPGVKEKVEILSNAEDIMNSMSGINNVNSCFISFPDGFLVVSDSTPGYKIKEDGSVITFPVKERPWYRGAVERGSLYFSEVERDVFSNKKEIVCAMPVYLEDSLLCVVGANISLDSIDAYLDSVSGEGHFVCILNKDGGVVFAPEDQKVFKATEKTEDTDLFDSGSLELIRYIKSALSGSENVFLVDVNRDLYYMASHKIPSMEWIVISVVQKELLEEPGAFMTGRFNDISAKAGTRFLESLNKTRLTFVVFLVVIFALIIISTKVLSKRIVKPIEIMTDNVKKLSGDNLQFKFIKEYQTGDEVEILASCFADLSVRTLNYIDEVRKITVEKEKIGAELKVAKEIQENMLPRLFPPYPDKNGISMYAYMNPAKEVGGDFYDFFFIGEDKIALVMADVSGKGIPAAMFMIVSRTLIKNRAMQGGTVSEILYDVNNMLCQGNEASLFVTVWLSIIDIKTGEGFSCNAGHEHPVLKRKNGSFELIKYKHSPAVALMYGMMFKERSFKLEPGDCLFVYTDGVAEANNPEKELFGEERLLRSLNNVENLEPENIINSVVKDLEHFVNGAEQFDDTTMLCFKLNEEE